MHKFLVALVLFCSALINVKAQSADDQIDADNFSVDLMKDLVLDKINQLRISKNMDTFVYNDMLSWAAQDNADDMTNKNELIIEGVDKRVTARGASGKNAAELVLNIPIGKGKENFTYSAVANEVAAKISKNKKFVKIIENPENLYTGTGLALSEDKKKMFVSQTFGNINLLNNGKTLRKTLPVKYTKSKRGLSPTDPKGCKAVDKFNDLHKLQQGLYLQGNKVYMKYDNFKKLNKLIKGDTDGFAVDIIQKEQYTCANPNIYDGEKNSKGILLKPVYKKKLLKKNKIEDPKANLFDGYVGKIPKRKLKKLREGYEMNLVVVMDRVYCREINRTYVEDGGIESATVLTLYPDTTNWNMWKPEPEKSDVVFNVPFKQGKSVYNPKDIKPFMSALNEPKHDINEISITAHSSMEGDSAINARLQIQRAESIMNSIAGDNKKILKDKDIKTSDSWEMFKSQVKGTRFSDLATKQKSEVKELLRDPALVTELEPILAQERFAEIKLKVTYDVSGANEEPYVWSAIRKAIAKKDAAKALMIQKYALKQVEKGRYDYKELLKTEIPMEAQYVSMHINKIYTDTRYNRKGDINTDTKMEIETLYKLAPQNDFAKFNNQLVMIKLEETTDGKKLTEMQKSVQELYNSKIPQGIIDALNLELQFKIIEAMDTADDGSKNEMVDASMERIKKIFNIEDANWQNALKLSYTFIKHNDYDFAVKSLAPFLEQEKVDEEVLFTYISAAAHFPDKVMTKDFRTALSKAKEVNETRYCELFGAPKLSFQLLDHPLIKDEYCKTCSGTASAE